METLAVLRAAGMLANGHGQGVPDALPLLVQGLITGAFVALACSAGISFAASRAWPFAWLGMTALAAAFFQFTLGHHRVADLFPGLQAWDPLAESLAGSAMALCFVGFMCSLAHRNAIAIPLLAHAAVGTVALVGVNLSAPWWPQAAAGLGLLLAMVVCAYLAVSFLKLRKVSAIARLLGATCLVSLFNLVPHLGGVDTLGRRSAGTSWMASLSAAAYLATALANLTILTLWYRQVSKQRQAARLAPPKESAKEHLRVDLEVTRRTTALNQALACAQEKNNQKIQTLSYVGHDMRAPLATILGYVRLLREGGRPPRAEHLDAIERSVAFQLTLIDDVLNYAKAELQPLHLTPSRTRLADFLGEIAPYASVLGQANQNRFVYVPPPYLPTQVEVDSRRLQQVLLNLLSNAAKFTQRGTIRLIVTAQRDTELPRWRVRFCVEDEGIGIELSQQGSIFDAFTQLERTSGGVGLGLFIAERIVKSMGGELSVSSVPGEGSAFSFEIEMPELDGTLVPALLYEDSDAGPAPLPPPPARMNVPPSPVRLELAILARDGRLTDIEDWLSRIVQFHPGFDDYYDEIRKAILSLDLMHLEALALQNPPS